MCFSRCTIFDKSDNPLAMHEVLVSKSWSQDGPETLFWNISISSRSENQRSWSRLGRQRLVLQAHFQRQKFTKLSTGNTLSAGLIQQFMQPLFLCHRLIQFMYYQAFVLFSTYLSIRQELLDIWHGLKQSAVDTSTIDGDGSSQVLYSRKV